MKPTAVIHPLVMCTVLALPATLAAQLEIEYLNRPNQIIVSWPSAFGTALEETLTLSDPESWKPIERKSAVLADRRFSYTKRKIEPEKFFRLQLATGEFSEPVFYPSSNGAGLFAIGDFDGDTHLDVATMSNTQKTLAVLLGDGTGALGSFTKKGIGLAPLNMVAADFNKDGKDDLVMGCVEGRDESGISVFLAGSDDFGEPIEFKVENEFPEEYVTLVDDFNEDGNLDIVAWGAIKSIMLLGNGAGAFPTVNVFADRGIQGLSRVLTGFKLADVNDDDNVDLVAGLFGQRTVTAVLGDGQGGFEEKPEAAFGGVTNTLLGVLGVGNFVPDADGKSFDDLLIFADSEMQVAIVKSVGDGTFAEGEKYAVHESENTNQGATAASGDFNNDGFTDFVVSSVELLPGNEVAQHLDLFYNDQSGSFVRRTPIVLPDFAIDHLTTLDMNKDGKTDIIGTARNAVVVLLGVSGK